MNSALTNFRFRQKDSLVKPEDADTSSIPQRILQIISKAIDPSKLVQYTFNMAFPVTDNVEKYNKAFDQICKRWKSKFGFPPVVALSNISHVAFTYAFTIFVDNPQILLERKGEFIEDIAKTVF